MWRPPQRIRHRLPEAGWPTAECAAKSRLFSPVTVGPMQLNQRTWVPAMVPWRATDDGEVSADVLQWYERFARGKPGVIVVEATGIRDVKSGPLLRIGSDKYLPGLRRLVDVVRRASDGQTRLLIQLIDFLTVRRRPSRERFFRQYLTLTDAHRKSVGLPDAKIRQFLERLGDAELKKHLTHRQWRDLTMGYRDEVSDMHLPQIAQLPQVLPGLFADAAERAERAGFDGVELHYAHAYTMASFLSARNRRRDGYGGSLADRVRLPLEVLRAVKQRLGTTTAVGIRHLADECIVQGSDVVDASYFAREFAVAGADFLSLSRGGKFDDAKQPKVGQAVYPYTGRSGYECMPQIYSDDFGPFARNFEPTAKIRESLRTNGLMTPIVVAGGICSFKQAENALAQGIGDVIAAARQSLADPDWFLKMRLGLGAAIRRCEYTNYCEALDQKHKQVTCRLWDRSKLANNPTLSTDGRRRLTAPEWPERE